MASELGLDGWETLTSLECYVEIGCLVQNGLFREYWSFAERTMKPLVSVASQLQRPAVYLVKWGCSVAVRYDA